MMGYKNVINTNIAITSIIFIGYFAKVQAVLLVSCVPNLSGFTVSIPLRRSISSSTTEFRAVVMPHETRTGPTVTATRLSSKAGYGGRGALLSKRDENEFGRVMSLDVLDLWI